MYKALIIYTLLANLIMAVLGTFRDESLCNAKWDFLLQNGTTKHSHDGFGPAHQHFFALEGGSSPKQTVISLLHQRQPQRLHPHLPVTENPRIGCRHISRHQIHFAVLLCIEFVDALQTNRVMGGLWNEKREHAPEDVQDASPLSLVPQDVPLPREMNGIREFRMRKRGHRCEGAHQIEAKDRAFDSILVAFVEVCVFLADHHVSTSFYCDS